jgi:hypothetical protein
MVVVMVVMVAMAADGAQQLTVPVGAVAGVQVGVVVITALAMVMVLATMLHQWFMQVHL